MHFTARFTDMWTLFVAVGVAAVQANSPDARLIEFYVPWCPYCQKFAPIFAQATRDIPQAETINCDEYNCISFGVTQYPTIAIVENGVIAGVYNGPLTLDGFNTWLDLITTKTEGGGPMPTEPAAVVAEWVEPTVQDVVEGAAKFFADMWSSNNDPMGEADEDAVRVWVAMLKRLPGNAGGAFENAENTLGSSKITRTRWATAFVKPEVSTAKCQGYTCSLWVAMHASVELTATDQEAFELLGAITRLVAGHFGCKLCREHFGKMVRGEVAGIIPSHFAEGKSASRLWLWAAHNLVSTRLKRGTYPSSAQCATCFIGAPHVSEYLQSVYTFAPKQKSKVPIWPFVVLPLLAAVCGVAWWRYKKGKSKPPTKEATETLITEEEATYLEVSP